MGFPSCGCVNGRTTMDTRGSAKHTILIVFPVMNGMRGSHPTLYGVPLMWLCGGKNHNVYTGFCKVHYLNLATRGKQCCLSRGCDSITNKPLVPALFACMCVFNLFLKLESEKCTGGGTSNTTQRSNSFAITIFTTPDLTCRCTSISVNC